MQIPKNITYFNLLNQINQLFTRCSLSTNIYLFKQIKNNLQLPIYIVIEERRISQITKDQNIILETLKMSDLVRVHQERKTVEIIDYPTIRIHGNNYRLVQEIQRMMKEKNIKYSICQVYESDNQLLITTESQKTFNVLEQIMITNKIPFTKSMLYDEMKEGVSKLKKYKKQQKQHNNTQNKNYYPIYQYQLPVFIRRAVDTDEEEEENTKEVNIKLQVKKQQIKQNGNKKRDKGEESVKESKKKYKLAKNVTINSQDFPILQ